MREQTEFNFNLNDDLIFNINGIYMNNKILLSIAVSALLMNSASNAQSQVGSANSFYGEIGFSPIDLAGPGGDAKPYGVRFLIGNELNKNLGLDVLYTTTVSKDSRPGYDASYSGFGVFLKPKFTIIDGTEVFARIGVVRANSTASASGSDLGSDVAYGAGIQTNLTKVIYGQIDYMHSYDRDNVYVKGFTFSVGTRF